MAISCKNSVEQFAFPILEVTEYRRTPLSVVYHILFQDVVGSWSDHEMNASWLQSRIEVAEGNIVEQAGYRLFRVLNNGPVSCFEEEIGSVLGRAAFKCNDIEELVVIHRNVAAFCVQCVLCGYSDDLRSMILDECSSVTVIYALASISSECVNHAYKRGKLSFPSPPKLVAHTHRHGQACRKLATEIMEVCVTMSMVKKSSAAYDIHCGDLLKYDSLQHVQNKLLYG
jgi:hypothetical protein